MKKVYEVCPGCSKKGLYKMTGYTNGQPGLKACRYCSVKVSPEPSEDRAKKEGELDSLIVHKTIINRIVDDLEKLLLRSREERRKLDETIKRKKDAYRKAYGHNPRYTPDDSKPSDIKEPSGA